VTYDIKYSVGLPAETEWMEFKEAQNSFDLIKYSSVFQGNETNLKKRI
jgi:hypothetical protein